MQKQNIILALCCLLLSTSAFAQFDSATVAVIKFLGGNKASQGESVASDLGTELSKYRFIKLVERQQVGEIAKELELGQSGLADDSTVAKAGKLHGAQIIIIGTVQDGKVTARAILVESSQVLASGSVDSVSELGTLGAKLAHGVEIFLAREKVKLMRNDNPDIKLEFWISKAGQGKDADITPQTSKARNKVGESTIFHFRCNKKGFVTIVDFQPSGEVTVLFPNDVIQDNKIEPGKLYALPSENDAFEFKVTPPIGTDTVMAFFTERKVSWLDPKLLQGEGFKTVKSEELQGMTRGITMTATELKKSEWTSRMIELEIVE